MVLQYRLWVEVEAYNYETGQTHRLAKTGGAEPVCLGEVATMSEAQIIAKSLDGCIAADLYQQYSGQGRLLCVVVPEAE